MMQIHLTLLSEATFGRGDGVSSLVDQEIEHDASTGLPIVRGRTLKGLLVEACADLMFALQDDAQLQESAKFLFGLPGSDQKSAAKMNVGTAQLPLVLRTAVSEQLRDGNLSTADILQSLTAIRRQTAVDDRRGVPDKGSLRAMRVLMRSVTLMAPLTFSDNESDHLPLLAACVVAVRRGGMGRTRGRGRLQARLFQNGSDITDAKLQAFNSLIGV